MTKDEIIQLSGPDLWKTVATELFGYKKDSYEYWNFVGASMPSQAAAVRYEIKMKKVEDEFIKSLSGLLGVYASETYQADLASIFDFMCAPSELQAKAALFTFYE